MARTWRGDGSCEGEWEAGDDVSANQDASESRRVRKCRRAVWPHAGRATDSGGRATMTQAEAGLDWFLVPRRAGVYHAELLWALETDGRVWGVEIGREDRTGMRGIRGFCAEATAHDAMRVIVVVNNEGVWVCGLEVWRLWWV